MLTTSSAGHTAIPSVVRCSIQESPVSRPRAVYSIDQILANPSKRTGELQLFTINYF